MKRRKVGQKRRPPKRANVQQRALWYKKERRRNPSTVVPFGIRRIIEKSFGG